MTWVRLDDAMPHHPKVTAAGPTAFALDVAALCYSNRYHLDGFIADAALPAVFPGLTSPRRHADKLVAVGRWHRDDDRVGYVIHDAADYQFTAEEADERRRKRAEAGRKGGKASGAARRAKAEANPKQVLRESLNGNEPRPDPTRTKELTTNPVPPRDTRDRAQEPQDRAPDPRVAEVLEMLADRALADAGQNVAHPPSYRARCLENAVDAYLGTLEWLAEEHPTTDPAGLLFEFDAYGKGL